MKAVRNLQGNSVWFMKLWHLLALPWSYITNECALVAEARGEVARPSGDNTAIVQPTPPTQQDNSQSVVKPSTLEDYDEVPSEIYLCHLSTVRFTYSYINWFEVFNEPRFFRGLAVDNLKLSNMFLCRLISMLLNGTSLFSKILQVCLSTHYCITCFPFLMTHYKYLIRI